VDGLVAVAVFHVLIERLFRLLGGEAALAVMVAAPVLAGELLPVLDPHKVTLEVEEVNLRAVCMRRDVKGHELPAERLCIHGRPF